MLMKPRRGEFDDREMRRGDRLSIFVHVFIFFYTCQRDEAARVSIYRSYIDKIEAKLVIKTSANGYSCSHI